MKVLVSICGEVEWPVELRERELAGLADGELVADFHCREGWSRPGQRWRGVRLSTLLALAGARAEGRHVVVASGGFTVLLDREEAEDERVLLALELDGRPLAQRDGLPRLVGPSDWDCFRSVKAVDRIELVRDPVEPTAGRIALGRLGSAEASR